MIRTGRCRTGPTIRQKMPDVCDECQPSTPARGPGGIAAGEQKHDAGAGRHEAPMVTKVGRSSSNKMLFRLGQHSLLSFP